MDGSPRWTAAAYTLDVAIPPYADVAAPGETLGAQATGRDHAISLALVGGSRFVRTGWKWHDGFAVDQEPPRRASGETTLLGRAREAFAYPTGKVMSVNPSFSEVVRTRRAVRSFLDKTVPVEVLNDVLSEAQLAPSNSNTQPWITHVVTGAARDRLSDALVRADDEKRYTLDFPYDGSAYEGRYGQRRLVQAQALLDAFGVTRDDEKGRNAAARRNLEFFGAPHVILLFMPAFGGTRAAADVGMYAQTLLLAFAARGLGGVAQTTLGFYADTVRETLGLPADQKLLFGISFGYPDSHWMLQNPQIGRASIQESVHFHQ